MYRFFRLSLVVLAAFLAACQGGSLYFEQGTSASTVVNENSTGVVWNAAAKVEGQGIAPAISYQISGPDAGLFSIDSAGAVSFLQPADFEQPADADKNNEYQVDIQASVNNKAATQSVRIKIVDVTNLQLQVLKPQINENVGSGKEVWVQMLVRFYDAEAGAQSKLLQGGAKVRVNGIDLAADAADPELWRGAVDVAGGRAQLVFTGQFSNYPAVTVVVPLFNKFNTMDFVYLRALTANSLFVGGNTGFFKIGFADKKVEFLSGYRFDSGAFINDLDFNSGYKTLFLAGTTSFSIGIFDAFWLERLSIYSRPPFSQVVSLFSDAPNKRLIAVNRMSNSGLQYYSVFSQPLNDNGRPQADPTLLWSIPADVIQGTFKFCNLHGSSKTIIIADERLLQGRPATVIQGFSEAGQKRFEAVVGPDISNLVVDESRSAVYVAEHHESSFAQLKAIDINSGEVSNLIESFGDAAVGAVTVLHMDNQNNQLYIGDNVSDTIFTLDFSARALRALSLEGFEFIDLSSVEVGEEN